MIVYQIRIHAFSINQPLAKLTGKLIDWICAVGYVLHLDSLSDSIHPGPSQLFYCTFSLLCSSLAHLLCCFLSCALLFCAFLLLISGALLPPVLFSFSSSAPYVLTHCLAVSPPIQWPFESQLLCHNGSSLLEPCTYVRTYVRAKLVIMKNMSDSDYTGNAIFTVIS